MNGGCSFASRCLRTKLENSKLFAAKKYKKKHRNAQKSGEKTETTQKRRTAHNNEVISMVHNVGGPRRRPPTPAGANVDVGYGDGGDAVMRRPQRLVAMIQRRWTETVVGTARRAVVGVVLAPWRSGYGRGQRQRGVESGGLPQPTSSAPSQASSAPAPLAPPAGPTQADAASLAPSKWAEPGQPPLAAVEAVVRIVDSAEAVAVVVVERAGFVDTVEPGD